MKAIEINGQIKIYDRLPKSWGNVLGGFNLLSDEQLKTYGFYDVVIPDWDSRIEEIGDLYFDAENEIFTKDVSNKTWTQSLTELKEQQIENLKYSAKIKLQQTDWYIIRNQESGEAIPESITTQRQEIRDLVIDNENQINALTTKKAVMSFDLPSII
jgi:hypothetical protein